MINTEHEIEIWVEKQIDRIDSLYMKGRLTTEEYDSEIQKINVKAKEMEISYHFQS